MNNNAINAISEMKKGVFGVQVVTFTEPRMRKTNNPYLGRVRKVANYTHIALGTDYKRTIESRMERLGIEGGYEVEKAKGMHRYNDFFMQSDKDENQFYLNIISDRSEGSHCEKYYMVDGRMATKEEEMEIESFCEKSGSCKKQNDAGLSGREEVKIIRPKLQNVIKIVLGDRVKGE